MASRPETLLQECTQQPRPSGTTLSGTARRSSRYKKRRTDSGVPDSDSRAVKKMLKLALAKSIVETKMVQNSVPLPHGAVFYPTREQFADPIKYIARYEPTASGFHLPLLFKWTLGFRCVSKRCGDVTFGCSICRCFSSFV